MSLKVVSVYYITIGYAIAFLLLQMNEYLEVKITMADSVYSSLFFLLTGFHGMHVLVGTIFIIVTYFRFLKNHFTDTRHLGFGLSLVY